MDIREAFYAAVLEMQTRTWDPAFPNQPTFPVNGDDLTIAEICDRAKDIPDKLPDKVQDPLFKIMHSDPTLTRALSESRTYAMGAQCLSRILAARSSPYRQK